MRMFNSKELGDCDCKVIQTLDAIISIANVGFAPSWYHRRSILTSYIPPGSGINTQTRKPEPKWWHASIAPLKTSSLILLSPDPATLLTQLSVHLQGCHRTTNNLQPCIQHIWPKPAHLSLDELMITQPYKINSTQNSMSNHVDYWVSYAVQLLSLLHYYIVAALEGEYCNTWSSYQQTHHTLTPCIIT